MRRVAEGGTAAFPELYDRIAPPIFRLFLSDKDDQQRAEHLTLRTMVDIWSAAASYQRQDGSVVAWALAHRQ